MVAAGFPFTIQNKYLYAEGDPINNIDPDGHWVIDAIFLAIDIVDFIKKPTWGKALMIGLDVLSFADPTGSASTALHAAKAAIKTAKVVDHAVDGAKAVKRTVNVTKQISKAKKVYKVAKKTAKVEKVVDSVHDVAVAGDKVKDVVKGEGKAKPITDPSRLLEAPKEVANHHLIPAFRGKSKPYADFIQQRGINVDDYTITVSTGKGGQHMNLIHGKGKWNQKWMEFIDNNPSAAAKDIYDFTGRMMDDYGLSGYSIYQYKK